MPREGGSPAFSGRHEWWPERESRLYIFLFLGFHMQPKKFLLIEFRIRIHETSLLNYLIWQHISLHFKRVCVRLTDNHFKKVGGNRNMVGTYHLKKRAKVIIIPKWWFKADHSHIFNTHISRLSKERKDCMNWRQKFYLCMTKVLINFRKLEKTEINLSGGGGKGRGVRVTL